MQRIPEVATQIPKCASLIGTDEGAGINNIFENQIPSLTVKNRCPAINLPLDVEQAQAHFLLRYQVSSSHFPPYRQYHDHHA